MTLKFYIFIFFLWNFALGLNVIDIDDILSVNYMPKALLLLENPKEYRTETVNKSVHANLSLDGSLNNAVNTMGFHRLKMTEYLCRNFVAEQIVNEMTLSRIKRMGVITHGPITSFHKSDTPISVISNNLLEDEGSTNYKHWLSKSTTLEDIYRHYNQVEDRSSLQGDEEEDEKNDNNDDFDENAPQIKYPLQSSGVPKVGYAGPSSGSSYYSGSGNGYSMMGFPPNSGGGDHSSYGGGGPYNGGSDHSNSGGPYGGSSGHSGYGHQESYEAIPKYQYHGHSVESSGKDHDLSHVFDITLTALAYLSFGMFLVHVIMCISMAHNNSTTTMASMMMPMSMSPTATGTGGGMTGTGTGGGMTGTGGGMTGTGDGGMPGGMTGDGGGMTGDGGGMTGNGGGMTGNGGGMTGNGGGMTGDGGGMTGNGGGMTGDGGGITGDGAGMTGDEGGMPGDGNGITGNGDGMNGNGEGMTGNGGEVPGNGDGMTGDGGEINGNGEGDGDGEAMTGNGEGMAGDGGAMTGDGAEATGVGEGATGDGGEIPGGDGGMTGNGSGVVGDEGGTPENGGTGTGDGATEGADGGTGGDAGTADGTTANEAENFQDTFNLRLKRQTHRPTITNPNNYAINELAKRVLISIEAALVAYEDNGNCLRKTLCENNKYSRELTHSNKLWMPVWSLGMSWLSGKLTKQVNPATSMLDGLKASILGLGKANCEIIYQDCDLQTRREARLRRKRKRRHS